jgi:HAD superfamily hydrolase (TIGR01484 family)
MRPLSALDPSSITTLLFDLDDTLLTHGHLGRQAYGALCDLAEAGLDLVAVTGRPAGWGEVLARQWPILGVVAENGAIALHRQGGAIVRSGGGEGRARALDLARDVAERFELGFADDNDARRTDVTLDIGETTTVAREIVEDARAHVVSRGARAIVSSVHLHVTFEGDDKASGVLRFLRERRGLDAGRARAVCAFVGDSENDAACFAAFHTTIGVANVAGSVARLSVPPRFVTTGARGAGFAELAAALLARCVNASA